MVESDAVRDESERLFERLNGDLGRKDLKEGFGAFSDASKRAVVERVATRYDTPPRAALLGRLLMIRNAEIDPTLMCVYLENLGSPDAESRKFCLLGLQELGYPQLADLALLSLRDPSDQVAAMAIDALVPHAKKDPILRAYLESYHAARAGQETYHMSVSLLEAHGFRSDRE